MVWQGFGRKLANIKKGRREFSPRNGKIPDGWLQKNATLFIIVVATSFSNDLKHRYWKWYSRIGVERYIQQNVAFLESEGVFSSTEI